MFLVRFSNVCGGFHLLSGSLFVAILQGMVVVILLLFTNQTEKTFRCFDFEYVLLLKVCLFLFPLDRIRGTLGGTNFSH